MRVLLIDFYDSFTYNLAHIVEGLGFETHVIKDHDIVLEEVELYDKIIFSPGPGLPSETRSLIPVLSKYSQLKPILGVCLGMQGIAEFYDSKLYNLKNVKHGVQEEVFVNVDSFLFKGLPEKIDVGLYHSWAVELKDGGQLNAVANSVEQVVMAIQHVNYPVFGVQFHPESILTPYGTQILKNFLEIE